MLFLMPPIAMELLKTAVAEAGYTGKVQFAMDVAASEFYQDGKYNLDFKSKDADASKLVSIDM